MAEKQSFDQVRQDPGDLYCLLRDRICLLGYPPGTVLREGALAAEFGLSRTPIRAALQRLAHDGLIQSRDGVGTIVTAPSMAEIRDIYLLRLKAAELIGQITPNPIGPPELVLVEALCARAEDNTQAFDIAEYWAINHDMHALIARIIGSSALRDLWDRLYYQAARIWYAHARSHPDGVADDLLCELRELKTAIARKDAEALGFVQRNHIAHGLQRLEAANAELEEKEGVAR